MRNLALIALLIAAVWLAVFLALAPNSAATEPAAAVVWGRVYGPGEGCAGQFVMPCPDCVVCVTWEVPGPHDITKPLWLSGWVVSEGEHQALHVTEWAACPGPIDDIEPLK